ncbi:MAG: hypothetical protein ACSHX9_15360 [Luteolibacter sp.]
MKTPSTLIAFIFLSLTMIHAEEWHTFTDKEGRSFDGSVLSVDKEAKTFRVTVKSSGNAVTVPFGKLIWKDLQYVKNWVEPKADETAPMGDLDDGDLPSSLYPRTKDEIKARIKEIQDRPAPSGIEKKQQETVNELNVYRYLCGVPDDVKADAQMVEEATEAAIACKEHGGLSHDLGHFTNKVNLSTIGDILKTPKQYINDAGANNREHRGHRRWCLNPPMGKTGFGTAGAKYSAMWAMDTSGSKIRDNWSYPGKGFFPKEYLHGNAWTLYLNGKAPPTKDLTVEVYKLSQRPEKAFSTSADIPGKALPVKFVSTDQNSINFEPEEDPITGRGIYWVRIKGGGVREGYVVELY